MPKRIEYLDIARGIGILLVVLGHNDFAALSPFFHQVIYSFHIPLFFFLSGYFINTAVSFFDYSKKRFHAVLKPYWFTILLIYAVSVSFEKMGFQNAGLRIAKALYGSIDYIDWAQLWFLPNLFVVSLYAFLFIRLTGKLQNRWLRWGTLLATLAVSVPLLHVFYPFTLPIFGREYQLYGLPFSLDLILLSGFFFILGNEVRQVTSERTFTPVLLLIGTGIGLLLLNFLFPYSVDVAKRVYQSFFVNTAEALLGILFVLAVARQIELHSRPLAALLRYFGNLSLIILLFHVPIQGFWSDKLMALTDNLPLAILTGFVMGVLGPVLIYEIFIRFNPVASFWFGRKAEPLRPQEAVPQEAENAAKPTSAPVAEIKEQ